MANIFFRIFILHIIFATHIYSQQTEDIRDIRSQYSKIINKKEYKAEIVHIPTEDCLMKITIYTKNGQIGMIETSATDSEFEYKYQYVYKNGKLIFVYVRQWQKFDTIIKGFEYRHYYKNGEPIKSLYKGFTGNNTKTKYTPNIDFYDYSKAYYELENGIKYLNFAKKSEYEKICQ